MKVMNNVFLSNQVNKRNKEVHYLLNLLLKIVINFLKLIIQI